MRPSGLSADFLWLTEHRESPAPLYMCERQTPLRVFTLTLLLSFILTVIDSFTVESQDEGQNYKYIFQLCGDAGGVSGAGIIQVDSKGTETKTTVIGQYNATEAIGGSKSLQNLRTDPDFFCFARISFVTFARFFVPKFELGCRIMFLQITEREG